MTAKIGEGSDLLKCSFCGKTQKQVKKLIAGPGVYICDECIDLRAFRQIAHACSGCKQQQIEISLRDLDQLHTDLGTHKSLVALVALADLVCWFHLIHQ